MLQQNTQVKMLVCPLCIHRLLLIDSRTAVPLPGKKIGECCLQPGGSISKHHKGAASGGSIRP